MFKINRIREIIYYRKGFEQRWKEYCKPESLLLSARFNRTWIDIIIMCMRDESLSRSWRDEITFIILFDISSNDYPLPALLFSPYPL